MRTRLRVDADQTIYALTDYYFYGKEGILTHMRSMSFAPIPIPLKRTHIVFRLSGVKVSTLML